MKNGNGILVKNKINEWFIRSPVFYPISLWFLLLLIWWFIYWPWFKTDFIMWFIYSGVEGGSLPIMWKWWWIDIMTEALCWWSQIEHVLMIWFLKHLFSQWLFFHWFGNLMKEWWWMHVHADMNCAFNMHHFFLIDLWNALFIPFNCCYSKWMTMMMLCFERFVLRLWCRCCYYILHKSPLYEDTFKKIKSTFGISIFWLEIL